MERLSEDSLREWVQKTLNELVEHPDAWPIGMTVEMRDHRWACMRTEAAPHYGDDHWSFTAGAQGVELDSSYRMGKGTTAELVQIMQEPSMVNECLFYISAACDRIDDKDDDYHSDFDW